MSSLSRMWWNDSERRRAAAEVLVACVFSLCLWVPASHAVVASGDDVQLQSLTLSGGGAVGMQNLGSGATATADIVVGQSSPPGTSVGASSGVRAQLGAIPVYAAAISVPEPAGSALAFAALLALGALRWLRASGLRRALPAALAAALLAAGVALPAGAQVPEDVNLQGRLLDNAGDPVPGPANITVRIYDAEVDGALVYQEDHPGTLLEDGVFSLLLGSGSSPVGSFDASTFAQQGLWLALVVDGDTMDPRQPFSSVPYAMQSDNAATLAGLAPVDFAASGHSHDRDYAAFLHGHADYSLVGHDHNRDYAALLHSHSGYAPLSHEHSADQITSGTLSTSRFDAYANLSASGRLDNNNTFDLLTRAQLDGRYIAGITTSSTSGLNGGVSSGTATLSVDPTDFNALPSSGFAASNLTVFTTTRDIVAAEITIPARGDVIAMARADCYFENPTSGNTWASIETKLCTTPDILSGTSCATPYSQHIVYENGSKGFTNASLNAVIYFSSSGTKTIYWNAQGSAGDELACGRRSLILFYVPR